MRAYIRLQVFLIWLSVMNRTLYLRIRSLVKELRRSGFRIRGVTKGADSIRSGIDKLKSVQIMVHQDSVNVIRELRNYAWKRDYKTNQVTNVPEDDNNHALDALRYLAMEKLKANTGKYSIR